jgi:hypothetical protein
VAHYLEAKLRCRAATANSTARLTRPGRQDALRRHLCLAWPGYFADSSAASPMPRLGVKARAYVPLLTSVLEEVPRLEAALPATCMPIGFLARAQSPLPVDQARLGKQRRLNTSRVGMGVSTFGSPTGDEAEILCSSHRLVN